MFQNAISVRRRLAPLEERGLNLAFLSLSFLSGVLELSPVLLLIDDHRSGGAVVAAGFAYQCGNLAASTTRLSKAFILALLILAAILVWWAPLSPVIFFCAVLLTSLGAQKLRRFVVAINDGPRISTLTKRSVRIIGFALIGLVTYQTYALCVVVVLAIAIVVALWRRESWSVHPPIHKPRASVLAVAMVVHQSHYFSYTYILPILFIVFLGVPHLLAGVAFVVGWISYTSAEPLTRRWFASKSFAQIFVGGHILVALSLGAIGLFGDSLPIVLAAWFASGLGGGTVYCLTRLNAAAGPMAVELEFWEDVGHVTGTLCSLVLAIALIERLTAAFFVSALLAVAAAMLLIVARERATRVVRA